MQIVKAIYDGKEIKPMVPIKRKGKTEVIVIFPGEEKKFMPDEARRLLRGVGKGEDLTEMLLKSRKEDIDLEEK